MTRVQYKVTVSYTDHTVFSLPELLFHQEREKYRIPIVRSCNLGFNAVFCLDGEQRLSAGNPPLLQHLLPPGHEVWYKEGSLLQTHWHIFLVSERAKQDEEFREAKFSTSQKIIIICCRVSYSFPGGGGGWNSCSIGNVSECSTFYKDDILPFLLYLHPILGRILVLYSEAVQKMYFLLKE